MEQSSLPGSTSCGGQKQRVTDISKAYNQALRFLTARARSVKETEDNLKKKGFEPGVIEETVSKLKQENLLNDMEFAGMFVESRERFRPKSKFALGYELRQKGISELIIEKALGEIDDRGSALKAVRSKFHLWQHLDREAFNKKAMNHLKSRGFGHGVSVSACEQGFEPEDNLKGDTVEN